MAHTYEFPRPALTVDCVVFGLDDENLKVLLIQRDLEPHQGEWALPGGFVDYNESLEKAAVREAHEETGLHVTLIQQLKTYSDPERDPRHHSISTVFIATAGGLPQAGDDASNLGIFSQQNLPPLVFDHAKILADYFTFIKKAQTQ